MNDKKTQANQADVSELEKVDRATWLTYMDNVYHFTIAYSPSYTVKQLKADELVQLSPEPIAAIYFQDQYNPLANIAPPAFSIRVFESKTQQPLVAWLKQVGLFHPAAGWLSEPYQGKYVTGLKIISSDYMAPGWFVYVMRGDQIFQLTPLGTEAELMLDTFSIVR